MSTQNIVLNGINALTGHSLVPPMPLSDAARRAGGEVIPAARAIWLKKLAEWIINRPFALPAEVDDPNDLGQVGWAVVFARGTPAPVREVLKPLLDRRACQAKDLFKELEYEPGESREAWLGRYGVHGADVVPEKVPFFLLLVGDPAEMPFEFQCLPDNDYAVGRLTFDKPEDYGRYAKAVVEYETAAAVPTAREVVYWGTRHDLDMATEMSALGLITPLNAPGPKPGDPTLAAKFRFGSRCLVAQDATKANLDAYLKDLAGGPLEVAAAPFVSALGQRLLAGGALAVAGHVERAWGYSLADAKAGPQIQPFRNLIIRLLRGERVGQSTLDFSRRYATYSADVLNMLDPGRPGAGKPADTDLVGRWIERNDAQNYVIIGDPAVRLRVEDLK